MRGAYKVAVITRTQDRPLFLGRAIKSVHNQSFTDFVHVIIVDAGNNTAVEQVLDDNKILTRDRVKVIYNEVSHGMEAASNKAIASVDSEYIAIHDDDDTWHPEFLAKTVKVLDEHSDTAGVVVRTDKIIEEVKNNRISIKKKSQYLPDVRAVSLYRQCIDNQMTPITFLYRRNVHDELGGYDESLPVLGDWDYGIRLLQRYDVEYLDPGFALANYHHRKYQRGSTANGSFGVGQDKHRYWSNKLMNKYLRAELADGRLGVGYIMSQLRYNQHNQAEILRRVLPVGLVNKIKKRIQN